MTKHSTILDLRTRAAVLEEIRFQIAIPESNHATARVLAWLFLSLRGGWLIALTHAACVIAKRVTFEAERTFDRNKAGGAYLVSACQKRSEGILWISLDRPLHLVPA
jgi:hypothetical protein